MSATARFSWSESAMRPAALATVCEEIAARRAPWMVECGSGFSTLALAAALRARDGRLVSLEHDPAWAERVRSELVAAELDRFARVVHAPLAPHPLARDGLEWYAARALVTLPARIDVLLVDGPPAFAPGHGLSRYPALPALADRLAPGATVVLDDIDRPGELEVLRAWERDHGVAFQVRSAERIALVTAPLVRAA